VSSARYRFKASGNLTGSLASQLAEFFLLPEPFVPVERDDLPCGVQVRGRADFEKENHEIIGQLAS
jgi:hypothetical protein